MSLNAELTTSPSTLPESNEPSATFFSWENVAVPLAIGCMAILVVRFFFTKKEHKIETGHNLELKKALKNTKLDFQSIVNDIEPKMLPSVQRESDEKCVEFDNSKEPEVEEDFAAGKIPTIHIEETTGALDDAEKNQLVNSMYKDIDATKSFVFVPGNVNTTSKDNVNNDKTDGISRIKSEDDIADFTVLSNEPEPSHELIFANASECAQCKEPFALLNRRHHCRKCLQSFCAKCSSHNVALNELSDDLSRVCDTCFKSM
eukprot:TRINITY_DN8300_c0_g2_i1.p1 TRINITY_DN8300_c0_g2~~TRINITY_DN8300_c0_g2_i1.p1  ORF type:complete len:260 (+),score=45.26 TRINITY_DN8300_c0_g2_i1:197-976(+)